MLISRESTEIEAEESGLFYRVFLPENRSDKKIPAVFLVHGRAGNAKVMWTFSKALQGTGAAVITPQAFIEDPIGGFSWWDVSGGRKAPLEELVFARDKLESFIELVSKQFEFDNSRIFAAGFSQGAGILSLLSLHRPSIFQGLALLAGFVPRVCIEENFQVDLSLIERKVSPPDFFIAHGSEDKIIPLERAMAAKTYLESLNAEVEFHQEPVGHKVGSLSVKALGKWFQRELGS